jgi:hypothetical protein
VAKRRKIPTAADATRVVRMEDGWLTKIEATHRARLKEAVTDLERSIIDQFRSLKTLAGGKLATARENLASAQQVHMKLVAEIERTYGVVYRSIVKDFARVERLVQKSFGALGEAGALVDFNRQMLEGLKNAAQSQFAEYGQKVQEAVARAMYKNIVAGAPIAKLEATIKRMLSGEKDARGKPMAEHAAQMASDAVRQYHQEVTLAKAEVAGLDHFLYYGNTMKTTRDFCRVRAGKVYSKAEIESWNDLEWDGKSGPPLTDRGGYNCRHMWRPVRKEWFPEALPKGGTGQT